MNNHITHNTMDVITYPHPNLNWFFLINKAPNGKQKAMNFHWQCMEQVFSHHQLGGFIFQMQSLAERFLFRAKRCLANVRSRIYAMSSHDLGVEKEYIYVAQESSSNVSKLSADITWQYIQWCVTWHSQQRVAKISFDLVNAWSWHFPLA